MNKLQWNFNRNSNIFIQENAFESVVCEMAAMLSRPQCVKTPPTFGQAAVRAVWTHIRADSVWPCPSCCGPGCSADLVLPVVPRCPQPRCRCTLWLVSGGYSAMSIPGELNLSAPDHPPACLKWQWLIPCGHVKMAAFCTPHIQMQQDPYKQTSEKQSSKYKTFHMRKCIWKWCPQYGSHFVQASIS